MKKLSIVAASVLAAALFFGCSNSSDSPLLPASGGSGSSSSSSGLPKSKGENPFKGKTFMQVPGVTMKFDASTYVVKMEEEIPVSPKSDEGVKVTETVYDYSYNTETKRLYSLLKSEKVYVARDGQEDVYIKALDEFDFSDDDGFLTAEANRLKPKNNKADLDELKDAAKLARSNLFALYGYTGDPTTTAVPNEVIARYKEMKVRRNKKLVSAQSYDLGSNILKLKGDYDYFPDSVKSLGDLYNNYSGSARYEDGNFVGVCQYSRNIYQTPDIEIGDGMVVVNDSISGNTIKTAKRGGYNISTNMFVYENFSTTLKGTANKVGDTLRVALKIKSLNNGSWQPTGTVVIPYATAANADVTNGVEWTEVTN